MVAALFQRLLVAGVGGRVVAGKPLQYPEFGESPGLLVAVAEVAVQCLGQPQAGGGGRIVAGEPLHDPRWVRASL